MDSNDSMILTILQQNGRASHAEMSRRVGLAPSAVLERVRKLQRRGIVQSYETRLDAKALGLDLMCFILIRTTENVGSTAIGERLARLKEVQEVHFLAGEYCYLLKCRVRDTAALTDLLGRIGRIRGIQVTQTTLVLKTIKESLAINLGGAAPAKKARRPPAKSRRKGKGKV